MIFQHTWQQILAGEKSQTRRLVQEGDSGGPEYSDEGVLLDGRYGCVLRNGRYLWQVGHHTYAVQPNRGKPSVGRIRLTGIRQERVNEISEADAIAEGVILPPCNYVGTCNSSRCPRHMADANRAAFATLWDSIHSGGAAYWTGPMVWVLEFELST